METTTKKEIVTAALEYMRDKNLKQEDLASSSGVNPSYLSAMLRGEESYGSKNAKEKTLIKDKWFEVLARAVGYSVDVDYWPIVPTDQYTQAISAMEDAKIYGMTKTVIGESGCGKTISVERFKAVYPKNTYVVTVSKLHKVRDVIVDLCGRLGIEAPRGNVAALRMISATIEKLFNAGERPVVIFDEAENLSLSTLGLMKAVYDALCRNRHCGMVFIGTRELLDKLDKMKARKKEGVAQFYRRIKAGVVILDAINPESFNLFFAQVEDEGLKKYLKGMCENYGVLHDYLEPALRASEGDGEALTLPYLQRMFYFNC